MKTTLTIVFTLIGFLLLLSPTGVTSADSQNSPKPAVTIVRRDPRFNSLIPADAVVEKVADGFAWVEGTSVESQGELPVIL